MKQPKYKIGDTVIAKGWLWWNLFEVIGGFWNVDEWCYTLSVRYPKWFDKRHVKLESEILTLEGRTK